MRLDDFDPNAVDVEDQRGGGGFRGLPLGGGRLGCGTIVIALIAALVFGVDPMQFLSGGGQMEEQGVPAGQAPRAGTNATESCTVDQSSKETCDTLSSLNKTWQPLFEKANIPFSKPKLVFYSQVGSSGCGEAQSAMGPFYCPSDKGIYIDTDFYRQMEQELGANGEFARYYVVAHEYGHHVQNLLGLSDQVRRLQQRRPSQANRYSVMLELQADCYAGVWAGRNRDRLDPGDMETGLNAAHQIGDDTLMRQAGRRPVEEAFTHGTSEQRMRWLRRGMETGNEDDCDTFGTSNG